MSEIYNTKLSITIESDQIASELIKLYKLDVDTKVEQICKIKKDDGWKSINFDNVENMKFILFSTIVSDEEFKVKFIFNKEVENEVIDTGNGVIIEYNYDLGIVPIIPNTLKIKYVIDEEEYEAIDDGLGKFTGTYINSDSIIDYTTGSLYLKFTLPPDNGIDITIDSCYSDVTNYLVFQFNDLFLYGLAFRFQYKIASIFISTESEEDQDIKIQILGIT